MTLDPELAYTHKSQYLLHVRLTGNNHANLTGNDQDNTLIGNKGNNRIDGMDGRDAVVFPDPESNYVVTKNSDGSITVEGDGTDTLINIEKVVFDGNHIESKKYIEPIPHGLR